MRTRQGATKGITLIEIMIAVSLMSMLSVGVLIAMRIGFTTMEKTDARLVHNRRVINSRRIIENEIQGFMLTEAEWRQQRPLFVEWAPDRMRFVTAYSPQDAWRGRPQIAEIQVIPGENNTGVRLILNETPYTGPAQAGLRIAGINPKPPGEAYFLPIVPGPDSFVLQDKVAYCRIVYLLNDPPTLLPRGIRIETDQTVMTIPLNAAPEPNGYNDQ